MDKKGQGTLVGGLIGIFIFAIIATALIPTVADQIQTATNSGSTNLSSTDRTLMQLWPTFIIIGGLIAILAAVGLG
jgi:ABC-type antimicrobial peptide transport system permease subunit